MKILIEVVELRSGLSCTIRAIYRFIRCSSQNNFCMLFSEYNSLATLLIILTSSGGVRKSFRGGQDD